MKRTMKDIEVHTAAEAWEKARSIFPGEYAYDSDSSERAGYHVFRGEKFYDYISDLGNRLEVNLANGITTNIWIISEEKTLSVEFTRDELEKILNVLFGHVETIDKKIDFYFQSESFELKNRSAKYKSLNNERHECCNMISKIYSKIL